MAFNLVRPLTPALVAPMLPIFILAAFTFNSVRAVLAPTPLSLEVPAEATSASPIPAFKVNEWAPLIAATGIALREFLM